MNAAVMGEISKEEFTSGLIKMGCDSTDKLKKKLPELRSEMKNDEKFREIYHYAYLFCREKGHKVCGQETGCMTTRLTPSTLNPNNSSSRVVKRMNAA